MDAFNSGPISPERNPPINPEYYMPSRFVISEIAMGYNTVVTTSLPHNYVIGQEVRLLIPRFWGAQQLNKVTGFVINVPSSIEVTVAINSLNATPFGLVTPHPQYPQQPQIIALGDVNSGSINATATDQTGLTIPGAFSNIGPN